MSTTEDGEGGPGSVNSWRSYAFNATTSRPSWLQATLADLDDKMKMLALNLHEEDDSDSFAGRAENYYRKRPQLLNLLQDLYNSYLSLADRYSQALIKQPHHQPSSSSPILTVHPHSQNDESDNESISSTLTYQSPASSLLPSTDPDIIIAQLVIKTVDYEILHHELGILEKCNTESSRKMELQRSLLEVLESERLILLNENARLGYQVNALAEENKGLASESMMMRRKASEVARCLLKMREDHRVCLLSRKIEDLQGQINGLEKRNREYYELLVRREEEEKQKNKKREAVALEVCLQVEKMKMENQRFKEEEAMVSKAKGWKKGVGIATSSSKWWERMKKFDLFFQCGHNNNPKSYGCYC